MTGAEMDMTTRRVRELIGPGSFQVRPEPGRNATFPSTIVRDRPADRRRAFQSRARPVPVSGGADRAERLAGLDDCALFHANIEQIAVQGEGLGAVIDDDQVAEAAESVRKGDDAPVNGGDRRALRRGDLDSVRREACGRRRDSRSGVARCPRSASRGRCGTS